MKPARYDFLLAALRLKASSGALTEDDIAGVNALLDPAEPITVPDVLAPDRSLDVPPASPPARTAPTTGTAPVPTTPPAGGTPSGTTKPTRARRG